MKRIAPFAPSSLMAAAELHERPDFVQSEHETEEGTSSNRQRNSLACLSSTETLIEEARNGHMFILVDDEDRENEGDLVIPAQFATPDAVTFMVRNACGLLCLAMTKRRADALGLALMRQSNRSGRQTAFTVSIEARDGVTTGISAHDRARTIAVAIDAESKPSDLHSPGHVFPLTARDGGTLVRAGHTEGAVDIARLAGLIPAGVICEIMNDDGTMARMPQLVAFARRYGLKIGTIADLIAYRSRAEKLVRRVMEAQLSDSETGDWNLIAFANTIEHCEHLALIKGNLSTPEPVLARVHAIDLVADMLGGPRLGLVRAAMRIVAEEGRGVIVLIRDPAPGSISDRLASLKRDKPRRDPSLRDYGVGAQILLDLGVRSMVLLSDTQRTIVGLEGYGLEIVEQRSISETSHD